MEKNIKRYDVWRSLKDGDFQEDDVWGVLDGYHQPSYTISNHTSKPSLLAQSFLSSEPRMIPERHSIEGMAHMGQHSAPVNVPEWSMVHRKKTKKADDDDDDDDENVSPEEYFLRRSRSSSSSSVMEGVGRKLKGRDLSRVRDAVLKKTGFLE
ncbi:protein S40-6 [Raphanus sativus]|uniref:Protein S40-6 n=1 Tax=Raphanus sativus TaxID=3726 RepID=A0A6J0NEM9_RAPSA|nr:protein S40-6 [Raphanus sativus]